MTRSEALWLIRVLSKRFSGKAMVDFGTPEDTLIATLLSARARDEQVIAVYSRLRARFPTLNDLATASLVDLEQTVSSIGLFRSKARAIRALATVLLQQYQGLVPKTLEELVRLPGIGRKTASCVLWYAYGIPAIAVDTHVFRIAHRLGWARGKTPAHVEAELRRFLPAPVWGEVNRVFVQFGRALCKPRTPLCEMCPAAPICPYARARKKRGTLAS